jgi:hypothetical protein
MTRIYIGGDSFCKYRYDSNLDWPKQLADLLGYIKIEGSGIEGESWWHTRRELQDCMQSSIFHEIDLFVICHTDSHRILTGNQVVQNLSEEINQARDLYYKYIHNYHVHNWMTQNWYQELNTWLTNKRVIHIQCFESTVDYFSILNGVKFSCPLTPISLREIRHDPGLFLKEHMNDPAHPRRNHFTAKSNRLLAKFIYDKYSSAIAYNELITDNFQDHRGA